MFLTYSFILIYQVLNDSLFTGLYITKINNNFYEDANDHKECKERVFQ